MRAFLLAALGLLGCGVGTASAGLIDQPRGSFPILYAEHEPASAADPDLQRYWPGHADQKSFDSGDVPRLLLSRMRTSSGQDLVVTLLRSRAYCGKAGCALRVTTPAGEVLVDTIACEEPEQHRLTDDGNVLIICDDHIAIFHRQPSVDGSVPGVSKTRLWHNGSIVEASVFSDRAAEIRYVEPRPGLPIGPGQLLFRGVSDCAGRLSGTAYTFSSACADAPYDVTGVMNRRGIRLTGPAPHRDPRSCDIVAYTTHSPHARLSFTALDRSTN